MKTIAFFNNKGGVGKTTLLYHLAWMYSEMGVRTVALDLDPQSNLTSMFLSEDRLSELWENQNHDQTIVASVSPLLEEGTGDVKLPYLEKVASNLALVPGDLGLARMEDELSAQWPNCLEGVAKAFRITAAFHRAVILAAREFNAELALIDVGPNLGALNRCAVIAADHVAVPLVPDLFSLQGLRNLGPTLYKWRSGWQKRLEEAPSNMSDPPADAVRAYVAAMNETGSSSTGLPAGAMKPAGYVVLQHAVRQSRPVKAYLRWAERIPAEYRRAMRLAPANGSLTLDNDPNCLAQLKHYRSLMPLAMEASKPIFQLKPADGAIGAHVAAVAECRKDFHKLAIRIAQATELQLPAPEGTLL
jgi:cellulose biosynthesis protein BcsQ